MSELETKLCDLIRADGRSMSEIAKLAKVNKGNLSRMLRGLRGMKADSIERMLAVMGYEIVLKRTKTRSK